MNLDQATIDELAERLDQAATGRNAIAKITDEYPQMAWDDAYAIQYALRARILGRGSQLGGLKMGLTSHAKMKQMGVDVACYGFLNADGAYLENLIAYGRLLVDMGRWDRALRVYQSLLMQQQNLPDGDAVKEMLLNLATTCHELGMTGQAQQHIKRLLELDPEHGPGLALRSRLV